MLLLLADASAAAGAAQAQAAAAAATLDDKDGELQRVRARNDALSKAVSKLTASATGAAGGDGERSRSVSPAQRSRDGLRHGGGRGGGVPSWLQPDFDASPSPQVSDGGQEADDFDGAATPSVGACSHKRLAVRLAMN